MNSCVMNESVYHMQSAWSCLPLQALEGLLEGMNPPPSDPDMFVSFRDCHILILRALQVRGWREGTRIDP